MGGGVSVEIRTQGLGDETEDVLPNLECTLKGLPEAIERAIYVRDKWPLIIDPEGQATRFLRYQQGSLLLGDQREDMNKENLRTRFLACLAHGGNFCVVFESLSGHDFADIFDERNLPTAILDRRRVFLEETWGELLRSEKGDPTPDLFAPRDSFAFIVVTKEESLPEEVRQWMAVIRVRDIEQAEDGDSEARADDALAGIFGAREIKRISLAMVEAAFDGDLDEVKTWLHKGYHVESADGRGHTGISEAAAQGHEDVIRLLLAEGGDPNVLNDTGRSALWRACYNGHASTLRVLLEAGADPSFRDRVSHEGPYDVAKTDKCREVLDAWDPEVTSRLCEERKKDIRARAEERLSTAAERDSLARSIIRDELICRAIAGDTQGLKDQLVELADDADRTGQRPRGTCEVRDDRGMTLLSLAAQHGQVGVSELLLTHWKTCDDDKVGLTPGKSSWECRVMKANTNSRDLKGWNPAAIAVFHESKATLRLLLRNGSDPFLKSSYNKSAWDMAQDEVDAAEKVVKSRAEIRGVINEWVSESGQQIHPGIQSTSDTVIREEGVPKGMPKEGTATTLAIEVAAGVSTMTKGHGKAKKNAKKPKSQKKR